jgi:hypothetical protein
MSEPIPARNGVLAALRRPRVRLGLLLLAFAGLAWAFAGQWRELQDATRASARALAPDWSWIALASLIVLATHAMLVQSWRLLLAGWGGHIRYGRAVQIWTIANLGRWIPGKVWQVGALGMLAEDHGVSPVAAAGAALLGTLLNIGAGFGITVLTGANGLELIRPGLKPIFVGLSALFLAGVVALPWVLPSVLRRIARWRGVAHADRQLSPAAVWTATAINGASWVCYGLAFACFSRGVTPAISGDPLAFVAVYTASYLIGYLVLFMPGGLGFREAALVAFLIGTGAAGKGDATILSVASRVWITVLEVLPGLIGLLLLPPMQRAALRRAD